MKKIDFAIEKGFRLFENGVKYFHFYMIQIQIEKDKINDGKYIFYLLNTNENIIYKKTIIIDKIGQRIITPNSHEDPLVEDKNFYMICFQLWDNDVKDMSKLVLKDDKSIQQYNLLFKNDKEETILYQENIGDIFDIFNQTNEKYSFLKNNYTLTSKKDCIFRLHLGDENGNYEEKEFLLKANEEINFKNYLLYSYVGLQCSYEKEEPEIEEKHIIIGQKGMTLTGIYIENIDGKYEQYNSLLPFDKSYQILFSPEKTNYIIEKSKQYAFYREEKWTLAKDMKELIDFYKKEKLIKFFETSLLFLEEQYRTKQTYGLNKLITLNKEGKKHIDLLVCQNCKYNSKCVQIIPSGISYSLFKKNILLSDEKQCDIYKLIKEKIND